MKSVILKIILSPLFWLKRKWNFYKLSRYYSKAEELPLKTFLQIISEGNYGLLKRTGKPKKNDRYALELWSEILLEFAELDGNMEVKNKFDKIVALRQVQNSYTTIKAMIRLLYVVSPSDDKHGTTAANTIRELELMGYKIDTTSTAKYKESLLKADHKANSLITIMRMKQNELSGEHDENDVNFEEIIAMLQMHFHDIKDDITLKKYLACKKVIKSRAKTASERA